MDTERIIQRHHHDTLIVVTALFLATWTAGLFYSARIPANGGPNLPLGASLKTGIDPNTAKWFEFAQLPGIGETVARRFEALRRQRREHLGPGRLAFEQPSDLTLIQGIGEKTVQRIEPFLRLPDGQIEY